MEYLAGRIGAVLSVASAGCNTTNLVANLEVGHSRSHGNDLSSDFKTGNVAGTLWRRIHANTLRRREIMRLLSKTKRKQIGNKMMTPNTCMTSGRLIPAAATLTNTSCGLGTGTGRSPILRTYKEGIRYSHS